MPVKEKYVEQYGLRSSEQIDMLEQSERFFDVINKIKEQCKGLPKSELVKQRLEELDEQITRTNLSFNKVINMKRYTLDMEKTLDEYGKGLIAVTAKIKSVLSAANNRNSNTHAELMDSVDKLDSMNKSIRDVVKSDMKRYEDAAEKLMGDKVKTYYRYTYNNAAANQTYGSRKLPNSIYSVDRTAVRTAVICNMLRLGYTAEQALDNEQLGDEKKKLYDEIAERMTNDTEQNQKWLAENYAEGLPKVLEEIDRTARSIDPDKADLNNKDFVVLIGLAQAQHDATQELEHCKKQFIDHIVSKGKGDPQQLLDKFNSKGYLSTLQEHISKVMDHCRSISDPLADPSGKLRDAVNNNIVFNWAKGKVFESLKADPNKHAYEVGADDEGAIMRSELIAKVAQGTGYTTYSLPADITLKEKFRIVGTMLDNNVINKMNVSVLPNGELNFISLPERKSFYRDKLPLDAFDKLTEKIDNAQESVIGGSGEYNKAAAAVEAFSEPFKTEMAACRGSGLSKIDKNAKLDELSDKARRTEEKICAYLDRKRRQGITMQNADEKARKRMKAMEDSLKAIRSARKDIDELIVGNMESKYRTAAGQWLKSRREIDKVALRNRGNKLSDEERQHLYKHMAIARVCYKEMCGLRDGKKEAPYTEKELNDKILSRMNNPSFIEAARWTDRKDAKQFMKDNGDAFSKEVAQISKERRIASAKQQNRSKAKAK